MCALFQGLQEPVVPAADEPKIKEDDGLVGVGCTVGGEAVCVVVEEHLAKFVEGQSARNIAHAWDRCWRGQTAQGRRGLGLHALSAVDLALWDLLGKITGEPCHAVRRHDDGAVPLIAATARPELARRLGFKGAKVALPRGPEAGDAGLRENAEAVHARRRPWAPTSAVAAGGRFDAAYAAALAKRCEADGVAWFEDCVPPDEPAARRAEPQARAPRRVHGGKPRGDALGLRRARGPGRRRARARRLPLRRGLGVLKIAALARARGVAVAPSGGGVYAYGLAMALPDVHKVTDECKNAPEPATKGRRSESAPTIRDGGVMAADRALAASLLG
ncbi:mandelate racemase/muconate lactonizing enzyme [Aureococcus anophagefferens]|nr:mandelate racemase/muconate lactonizing enzyme [Aureococcus anophagefferens]